MLYKVNLKWKNIEQNTFEGIKCIVTCDTLLELPGFNKRFGIHTDTGIFYLANSCDPGRKTNLFLQT